MHIERIEHWDVLARACIDGRFVKPTVDWLTEKTGGVFDFRTGIGSSKAIIASEDDRESFFRVVETSVKLHGIKEIWIIDHIDCGAYGGSERFHEDKTVEREFHIDKLKQAAEIVAKHFPSLIVRKFYADWENIKEV
jgi:carbonic anhydrase